MKLTLSPTEAWLIKNRLFLVGALAPRPLCVKDLWKSVKPCCDSDWCMYKTRFNPIAHKGVAY